MDIKKYKILLTIIGVVIVMLAGLLISKFVFRPEEGLRKTEVPKVGRTQKKKTKKADLARELFGKQLLGIPQENVPVRVFKVSRVDYNDDLPVIGTIKSIPNVDLKFQRNGLIEKFYYDTSDRVKKGDVIAVLDQEDAKLEVEWAQAKIRTAQAEAVAIEKKLQVMEKLYETGALIEAKVEELEAQLKAAHRRTEQAEVELKSAKAKLKKTYLYAPSDGILGEKEMQAGEFVTPNDKVTSLLDPENFYAEAGIIEKDIGKVKLGQRARVIVDTYMKQEIEFWGVVEKIFPNIESKSRTLTVRIKITSSRARDLLLHGMFARVKIFIYSKKNAIAVPETAFDLRSRPPEVSFVEDGKVVNRPVTLDWVGTDYIVVRSGVNVGDIVVTETPGLKKLKTGTSVEIIEEQTSAF